MQQPVNARPEWAGGERFALASVRVLVIDDQASARLLLGQLIRSIDPKIDVQLFDAPLEAIEWARVNSPDLILTDYRMTQIDGIETIRRLRQLPTCVDVPIMMVTVIEDAKICHAAFDAGVTDFLVKPYDHYECRARCRNLLALREQHLLLRDRARLLEREITAAVRELRYRERENITLAANLAEFHSHQNGLRLVRIAKYARMIADAMELPPELAERIEVASVLHDIGTIGIADEVLLRAHDLTEVQEQTLKEHTEIGYRLLEQSSSEYLKLGAEVALHHHERYDGRGYPKGLKARAIPVAARIVAVAEVFDRLTATDGSDSAHSAAEAMRKVRSKKGTAFDPVCVEALASQLERAEEIIEAYGSAD
jgi:two-component system response regulator RpfG